MGRVCGVSGTCWGLDWVWQGFGEVREAVGAVDVVLQRFGTLQWELLGGKGKVVHPGFPPLHHH